MSSSLASTSSTSFSTSYTQSVSSQSSTENRVMFTVDPRVVRRRLEGNSSNTPTLTVVPQTNEEKKVVTLTIARQ